MPRDDLDRLRDDAWTGDAVLCLFAREWIRERFGGRDGALQTLLTSNHFLARVGEPTAVEARIGRAYREGGLAGAFSLIERDLLPAMETQIRKHHPNLTPRLREKN